MSRRKKKKRNQVVGWVKPSSTNIRRLNYAQANADSFLQSYEWRRVRMAVLEKYGARCQCCGATAQDGVRIHVDHIKPRRIFPQLALDPDNLQVLCEDCNHGKGNWNATDWRPAADDEFAEAAREHLKSIIGGR